MGARSSRQRLRRLQHRAPLIWEAFRDSLFGATRTSAMIALILMGASFLTLAMGFKLVQKEKSVRIDIPPETPSTELVCELDNILDNLKGTFKIHQRKLGDQRHGSIYSDVYTALGFKHPRRRKSTTVGNDVGPRKRRRRAALQKPPPPPKPLPPAIDVRALVDEIKSGRYPSFRIFEGEHDDYCVLCKKGGNMYCCEFCKFRLTDFLKGFTQLISEH